MVFEQKWLAMFLLEAAMTIEISDAIVGCALEKSGLVDRVRECIRPTSEHDRKA